MTRRLRASLLALLTCLSTVAIGLSRGAPASAAPDPVDVPTSTLVPTTATSVPFGSSDRYVADLRKYGYVQEEYFISGTADGEPYTTRLLVRRPEHRGRFSGVVIYEVIRNTGSRSMWGLAEYLMRSGHAYVEVAANTLALDTVVKPANPARYASLTLPLYDFQHTPDLSGPVFAGMSVPVMAQGAALVRDQTAGAPFAGFDVDHVILAGYSQQGLAVKMYMYEGHQFFSRPDGGHLFDAYFPAGVATHDEFVPYGRLGPNRPAPVVDVPTIFLIGESEVDGNGAEHGQELYRRADDNLFRLWEVAGMGHGSFYGRTGLQCQGQQPSQFPWEHVLNNGVDKLIDWVATGHAPPSAPWLQVDPATRRVVKDENGIAVGGVRTAYVDAPTTTYDIFSCAALSPGVEHPLPADLLESRYCSHNGYLRAVRATLNDLVAEGFYLREDARQIVNDARDSAVLTGVRCDRR